jgi:quercetin dioxygenase-like cupin family protein
MANLTYTRIFADDAGTSHFEELPMELDRMDSTSSVPSIDVAGPLAVSQARFSVMAPGFVADWHPAPRVQYSLHLSGELEVETGDGDVRRLGPGSIVLLEDVHGQGHRTRVIGDQPMVGVFLHVPQGV